MGNPNIIRMQLPGSRATFTRLRESASANQMNEAAFIREIVKGQLTRRELNRPVLRELAREINLDGTFLPEDLHTEVMEFVGDAGTDIETVVARALHRHFDSVDAKGLTPIDFTLPAATAALLNHAAETLGCDSKTLMRRLVCDYIFDPLTQTDDIAPPVEAGEAVTLTCAFGSVVDNKIISLRRAYDRPGVEATPALIVARALQRYADTLPPLAPAPSPPQPVLSSPTHKALARKLRL